MYKQMALCVFLLLLSSCQRSSWVSSRGVVEHESPQTPIPVHDVLELPFLVKGTYNNHFFDAGVQADFIAPDGRTLTRTGFYHSGDTWMVRFRPDRPGQWQYRYRFYMRGKLLRSGEGGFRATASTLPGGIHVNQANPYRWVYDNGQPYFP